MIFLFPHVYLLLLVYTSHVWAQLTHAQLLMFQDLVRFLEENYHLFFSLQKNSVFCLVDFGATPGGACGSPASVLQGLCGVKGMSRPTCMPSLTLLRDTLPFL